MIPPLVPIQKCRASIRTASRAKIRNSGSSKRNITYLIARSLHSLYSGQRMGNRLLGDSYFVLRLPRPSIEPGLAMTFDNDVIARSLSDEAISISITWNVFIYLSLCRRNRIDCFFDKILYLSDSRFNFPFRR